MKQAWKTKEEMEAFERTRKKDDLSCLISDQSSEENFKAEKKDETLELVDIGANLAHRSFQFDFPDVLRRALENGVSKIFITGTSVINSRKAVQLASRHPGYLYTTAGIHPHDAKHAKDPLSMQELKSIVLKNPEIVRAVGECGLDFDRNFSSPEEQISAFRAQLELASELRLPVFLHERKAHRKFLEIMKEFRPRLTRAVVHCFTGTREELQEYLKLDLHIGITGWINDERRGLALRKIVNLIPLSRLMIET